MTEIIIKPKPSPPPYVLEFFKQSILSTPVRLGRCVSLHDWTLSLQADLGQVPSVPSALCLNFPYCFLTKYSSKQDTPWNSHREHKYPGQQLFLEKSVFLQEQRSRDILLWSIRYFWAAVWGTWVKYKMAYLFSCPIGVT